MTDCTPAPTCRLALNEATQLWPQRSKASDGICAGAAHHQQSPNSDHESGDAFDLTVDPIHGVDCATLCENLRVRRDSRVKYVIYNRRMFASYDNGTRPPWTWGPYSGSSPHTEHMHVSILPGVRNDLRSWWGQAQGDPDMTPSESKQLQEAHDALGRLEQSNYPQVFKDILAALQHTQDRLVSIEKKLDDHSHPKP